MKVNNDKYEKISQTAILTSYPLIFTDIPHENEVFEAVRGDFGEIDSELIVPRLAVELEARRKLIDEYLDAGGFSQVLEFAAGYGTRGAERSVAGARYLELDLPSVAERKRRVLDKTGLANENLRVASGNALSFETFEKDLEFFDEGKPVAVVNGGLMRYLNFEEKAEYARNVRRVLERFGGSWITSDVTPKKFLKVQNEALPNFNKTISGRTGDYTDNMFMSMAHVEEFFGELGFEVVAVRKFSEMIDKLSSPERLGISREEAVGMIERAIVVEMRLK